MKKQVKKVTKIDVMEDVKNRSLSNTCRIEILEDALKNQQKALEEIKATQITPVIMTYPSTTWTYSYVPPEPKPSIWQRFKKWLKR